MGSAEVAELKETLISMKQTIDITLREEMERNWSEITHAEYLFDRHKKQVGWVNVHSYTLQVFPILSQISCLVKISSTWKNHLLSTSSCLIICFPQVDLIQEVTKEVVIECLRELVSAKSPNYRKLSVQVVGASDPEAGTPPSLDALIGQCQAVIPSQI